MNIPDIFNSTAIIDRIRKDGNITVSGLVGSSDALFITVLRHAIKHIHVIAPDDRYERLYHDLKQIEPSTLLIDDTHLHYLPAPIIVTTEQNLDTRVHEVQSMTLHRGQDLPVQDLINAFERTGYVREDIVEDENEYAIRGGIIDLYPMHGEALRLEFYGEILYSIRKFSTQNQRSFEEIETTDVVLALSDQTKTLRSQQDTHVWTIAFTENVEPQPTIAVRSEGTIRFDLVPAAKYYGDLKRLRSDIDRGSYTYYFYLSSNSLIERIRSVLGDISAYPASLSQGFIDERNKTVHITDTELFGAPIKRKQAFKGLFIDDLLALKENDFVVHADYGIGQFKGLTFIEIDGRSYECLRIDYAGTDKVYLPIERINLIERYVAAHDRPPVLSRLGSDAWIKTRKRIKKATERLAIELLDLYARRAQQTGFSFSEDTMELRELETSFPYEETHDQLQAINDVKKDMESLQPAERLICGDVGYGKTEIALRAAFKAALDGKQTMLLCPTTLLAFQHFTTFQRRLAPFPVEVAMVSRFVDRRNMPDILGKIAHGHVDIVIGTHRLLQPDVVFKDLGVLIIDEEQRFGVAQKEKIKHLAPHVDTFFLSATPIPRTLYMALSGLKNISTIHTPPPGRQDIFTKIIYYDENEIETIIKHELTRGGQVFFVHNRIQTIQTVAKKLQYIVPEAKLCILHGRMHESVTTRRMVDFINGKHDILLSTAIVESGLDLPNVNTIIVDNAHTFGLADLHQLRGRVGRSKGKAYAYFIIPSRGRMTEEAHKRLSALASYSSLGSGFRLALRDMEIRGVGSLLGREQSGHIDSIGYHLYMKMLDLSIHELHGRPALQEPVLDLKFDAFFPKEYIESGYERSALYKRLLAIESQTELNAIREEITDRFGKYPPEVADLFTLSVIRIRAREIGAHEVVRRDKNILYYREGIVIKTETCK
jgi:transcription-repair coupling factor (superfamily II helicase)